MSDWSVVIDPYVPTVPRHPDPNTIPFGGSVGSDSGSITQQVFIDRDPDPPNDPSLPAFSYPSGGGPATEWDVDSQTWK